MAQLVALVVEEFGDLAGDCGHDVRVEESIQAAEKQRSDNDGDENLHAGIDIPLRLDILHGELSFDCRRACLVPESVETVPDFPKHTFFLSDALHHKNLFLRACLLIVVFGGLCLIRGENGVCHFLARFGVDGVKHVAVDLLAVLVFV